MNKSQSKYDTNFTARGLLIDEFIALLPLLKSDNFDEAITKEIEENNLIKIDTKSGRKRAIAEIKRRAKLVSNDFWSFFSAASLNEKKIMLFYLCLRAYPIVFDIHFEVAVKKFKTGNQLTDYDIQMKLDEIASKDEHVANWSDSTLKKINTQYRTVLKESGLLKNESLKKSEIHNSYFWRFFKDRGENWFLYACFIND